MNAAQVRAKARRAMKRREEEIEQEEIEGGEINLVPYLDIVTNLMLFLLASITSGLILGQLNTTLPDQGPPQAAMAQEDPDQDPNQKPLKLVVSVTKQEIIVWSISGLEGTLQQPKATIPRLPDAGDGQGGGAVPVYDYARLNQTLYEIAARRWRCQKRELATYQAVLMPDGDIPYGTIIAAMDAMRCKLPPAGSPAETCYLPSDDKAVTDAEQAVDDFNRLFDAKRVSYDPDRFALFHDILFSTGFE